MAAHSDVEGPRSPAGRVRPHVHGRVAKHRPRCVFVGPGRWGRLLLPHVRSHFDVTAVVSTGSPGSSRWTAARCPDALRLTDLDEALSLPALDAVVIAAPTPTHPTMALKALETGCHVFVEKPLALRFEDAERAVRAALAADRELFIGYVYLFHPGLQVVQSLAPPDSIRSLHFDWTRPGLVGSPREELLCHEVAIAIALTDETPHDIDVEHDDEASFCAKIRLPSGRPCSVVLRTLPSELRRKVVSVECEDGATHVWCGEVVSTTRNGVTTSTGVGSLQAIPREVAAFDAGVRRQGPRMIDDLRFALDVTRLVATPSSGARS